MQMTSSPRLAAQTAPDLDLLEYVLVSAPSLAGLAAIAAAVVDLVSLGTIRVLDAVVLVRPDGQAAVRVDEPGDHKQLAVLARIAEEDVLLSAHDVELAAVTLAPEVAALLLLVEDRWADALSAAARAEGGRLSGGERIARDRVVASLDRHDEVSARRARSARGDLLARSPLCLPQQTSSRPLVDQADQVRQLARLVERGLLTLDQYEVQRRRVLDC